MRLLATVVALACAVAAWAGAPEGETLYEQRCRSCHSVAGKGGKMAHLGGTLDDVGTKHDGKWLAGYLRNPTGTMPGANMPKITLDDRELDDLVAYLETLNGPAPAR